MNMKNIKENIGLKRFKFLLLKKHIAFVHAYDGYDYYFDGNGFYDSEKISIVYASARDAKLDPIWINYENYARKNPERFNFYEERICSKDVFDEDFYSWMCN